MNVLNLPAELERRDLGVSELAEAAGISRATAARIARGASPGRPRTRRLLRAALKQFPIEELEPQPLAQPDPAVVVAVEANKARLKAHLATPRDPWEGRS